MNESPQHMYHKRKWSRFSLRTFLIIFIVFAIAVGQFIIRSERQRKIVQWCLKNEGSVVYEFEYDSVAKTRLKQPPNSWDWHKTPFLLDYFSNVLAVDLTSSNGDLSPLAHLPKLDRLALRNTRSDELSILCNFTRLTMLSVSGKEIDDLTPLAQLNALEQLGLKNISASNLDPLASLTNLKCLSLDNCFVNGLSPLLKMNDLNVLILQNTPVADDELERIKQKFPNCVIQVFNR